MSLGGGLGGLGALCQEGTIFIVNSRCRHITYQMPSSQPIGEASKLPGQPGARPDLGRREGGYLELPTDDLRCQIRLYASTLHLRFLDFAPQTLLFAFQIVLRAPISKSQLHE